MCIYFHAHMHIRVHFIVRECVRALHSLSPLMLHVQVKSKSFRAFELHHKLLLVNEDKFQPSARKKVLKARNEVAFISMQPVALSDASIKEAQYDTIMVSGEAGQEKHERQVADLSDFTYSPLSSFDFAFGVHISSHSLWWEPSHALGGWCGHNL